MRTLSTLFGDSPFRPGHERTLREHGRERVGIAPSIDELATRYEPSVREAAIVTWRARMVNEHRSSSVFAGLLPQLIEASSALDVQTAVLTAATDEIVHATLCGDVVKAFGAEPIAQAEPDLTPLPRHTKVDALERVVRNVMFVGCLSETVAVALLEEERALAHEPWIERVLETILADEIAHARLGWQFVAMNLPNLADGARERLAAYLRVSFAYLERRELELLPVSPPLDGDLVRQRESLGLCSGSTARGLFFDTLETVIVPRFEDMGIAARAAYRDRVA